MMRIRSFIVTAALGALVAGAVTGCTSTGSDSGGSGLGETFSPSNYRRSNDINGTNTRPDVYNAFTRPSMPTIVNRGN